MQNLITYSRYNRPIDCGPEKVPEFSEMSITVSEPKFSALHLGILEPHHARVLKELKRL